MIPINIDSAKTIILSLIKSSVKNKPIKIDKLHEKIEIVITILKTYDDLNHDHKIFKRIIKLTTNINDSKVKQFRYYQSVIFLISFEDGIGKLAPTELLRPFEIKEIVQELSKVEGICAFQELTVPRNALEKLDKDKFWDFVKNNDIQKLLITSANLETITYDKTLHLNRLIELKPPLESLIQLISIRLSYGKEQKEFQFIQAILLLCGEWFITKFSNIWSTNKPIDLTNFEAAVFYWIESKVRTGVLTNQLHTKNLYDYEKWRSYFLEAADFLQSPDHVFEEVSKRELPNHLYFGQNEWEKFLGEVGDVPKLPEDLLNALKDHCPIFNDLKKPSGPKMWQTHQIFYMPPSLNNEKLTIDTFATTGMPVRYKNHCGSSIVSQNTIKNDQGYWFAIVKDYTLENDAHSSFGRFQHYHLCNIRDVSSLTKQYPEYDLPWVLEALTYRVMLLSSKLEEEYNPEWTYLRCKETAKGDYSDIIYHVSVGRERFTNPRGIVVHSSEGPYEIWTLPVRRFFPKKED